MALHLNKPKSPSPKDDSCQVWLKLDPVVMERRQKCKNYDNNGNYKTTMTANAKVHAKVTIPWKGPYSKRQERISRFTPTLIYASRNNLYPELSSSAYPQTKITNGTFIVILEKPLAWSRQISLSHMHDGGKKP